MERSAVALFLLVSICAGCASNHVPVRSYEAFVDPKHEVLQGVIDPVSPGGKSAANIVYLTCKLLMREEQEQFTIEYPDLVADAAKSLANDIKQYDTQAANFYDVCGDAIRGRKQAPTSPSVPTIGVPPRLIEV